MACRYADYHEARVTMKPLVTKPLMSSVNSLKVLVGVWECKVRKKTSRGRITREDLVDENTGDELTMSWVWMGHSAVGYCVKVVDNGVNRQW